jgi:hypothetical protein
MQSKLNSFIESLWNVAIGFSINLVAQILIFPLYGIHLQTHQNFTMGLWFTGISIARSYFLRRYFTKRTESPKC